MNIVFLGGGRITSAMLAGLRLAKTKHHLIVHDRHPAKLRDLKRRYAVTSDTDLHRVIAQADMLLIAVRPSSVAELLRTMGRINRPLLAVSLAAGIPLRILTRALGPPVRWARAMPSPVCRSGRGLTAITFPSIQPNRALPGGRNVTSKDRENVNALFGTFGAVVEIPESKFDAFTVTYSCSHGYHALAALARVAQKAGLDRKIALVASAHALADSIVAWREGDDSVEALLDEAATPGGIAATTAAAMDAAGYNRAIRLGMTAGLHRARANARQ